MNHATLVRDAAARSGLPEATVETVVGALADLVHHSARQPGRAPPRPPRRARPAPRPPRRSRATPPSSPELVERAKAHPLGLDYLKGGHLGSVAATFETHAFTVLAARDLLR